MKNIRRKKNLPRTLKMKGSKSKWYFYISDSCWMTVKKSRLLLKNLILGQRRSYDEKIWLRRIRANLCAYKQYLVISVLFRFSFCCFISWHWIHWVVALHRLRKHVNRCLTKRGSHHWLSHHRHASLWEIGHPFYSFFLNYDAHVLLDS